MTRPIDIRDFGADASHEDNYSYIQDAINSDVAELGFGEEGETYIVSQPLLFLSNKDYVINSTIKIKDGTETLLTSDTAAGDTVFPVTSVEGFNVGEYVGIWDDQSATGYDQKRATTGRITDITGLNITIHQSCDDGYEVTENATLGHVQNVIIVKEKENIKITGVGTINGNRLNQSYVHPIHNDPANEYQLAACAMTVYDSENVEIDGLTFKNTVMHGLAITGIGEGGARNYNITVKNVIAEDTHEKNILVRLITGGYFENILCQDSLVEDALIFYAGCVDIECKTIVVKNAKRGGFFWNSASNSNLVASDITTEGNRYGIYISSKNAVISDVVSNDPTLINGGFEVSGVIISNITYNSVVPGIHENHVIRLSGGGVEDIEFIDCEIRDCSDIAIVADSLIGGSPPTGVKFTNGGIYNHTGVKTDIVEGAEVIFDNFEGLD